MRARRASLDRRFADFKGKTGRDTTTGTSVASGGSNLARLPVAGPVVRPATMEDVMLRAGERGLILGMTREGKSTFAEVNINYWYEEIVNSDILILDSKPRFRAEWQLSGLPAAPLYREWDYGTKIPHSVVIPLRDPASEVAMAWSLRYRIIIAQIPQRSDIPKLDAAIHAAYTKRRKGRKLFIYVDEMNNFFKIGVAGVKAGNGIIMAITSGGEKSTAFLGAAQRPRNISVEALESMTKLFWFYTPFEEDNKHLRSMDLPINAQPPASRSYAFYFFDRLSKKQGMARVKPVSVKPKFKKGSKGWINYG